MKKVLLFLIVTFLFQPVIQAQLTTSLHGGAAKVQKDGDWNESYSCNLFDL